MEIAIIADDSKKELMTQFCIAYCNILAKHNICSTGITGKYISDATGLKIEKLLSGTHGGVQQIASRVSYNEIDVVLFFRASGTHPLCILCARPSTTAVFPTPGSPIRQGLFFILLERIAITRSVSESRPITVSSLPFAARALKSLP